MLHFFHDFQPLMSMKLCYVMLLPCRPAPEWRQALSAIEQSPATRRQQHQTQQQPLPDSRASSKSGESPSPACLTFNLVHSSLVTLSQTFPDMFRSK